MESKTPQWSSGEGCPWNVQTFQDILYRQTGIKAGAERRMDAVKAGEAEGGGEMGAGLRQSEQWERSLTEG